MRHASKSSGFSLTEILIVVAIVGLAVAIAIPLVAENVNHAELGDLGLTDREVDDLVAFLRTLTDGYRPGD